MGVGRGGTWVTVTEVCLFQNVPPHSWQFHKKFVQRLSEHDDVSERKQYKFVPLNVTRSLPPRASSNTKTVSKQPS